MRERPFELVPNPRFLFLTPGQREAFSSLRYGLTTPKGLTLLLGDAGTGKTTLVNAILAEISSSRLECVLISNPTLTRAEFYEHLTVGFGLSAAAAASKTHLLQELREYLLRRSEIGLQTALVLDEAQSLPPTLLEEVRLLGNIETTTVKLLNIVLAGQPELAARLNEASLRQLKQRIALRCQLMPLTFGETAAYIAGRLSIAGGDPRAIFSQEAVTAVYEATKGIPRTINVVCDNAMLEGFANGQKPVTRAMVEAVCRDFEVPLPATLSSNGNGAGRVSGAGPFRSKPSSPPARSKTTPATAMSVLESPSGQNQRTEQASSPSVSRQVDTVEPGGRDEVPMFESVTRKRGFSFFS